MLNLSNYDRRATAGPPEPEACGCGHEFEDHFEDESCGACDCITYHVGPEDEGWDIDAWVDAQLESPAVF